MKTVTRKIAIAIIRRDGCDVDEFFDEMGYKDEYLVNEVLTWLGY